MPYGHSVKVIKIPLRRISKKFGKGDVAGLETYLERVISSKSTVSLGSERKPYDHLLDLYHENEHIVISNLLAKFQIKCSSRVEEEIVSSSEKVFVELLKQAGLTPLLKRIRYR